MDRVEAVTQSMKLSEAEKKGIRVNRGNAAVMKNSNPQAVGKLFSGYRTPTKKGHLLVLILAAITGGVGWCSFRSSTVTCIWCSSWRDPQVSGTSISLQLPAKQVVLLDPHLSARSSNRFMSRRLLFDRGSKFVLASYFD